MGAVNSASECCFGEKIDPKASKINQKAVRDSHTYHTMNETRSETIEFKSPSKQLTTSLHSINQSKKSPAPTFKSSRTSLRPSKMRELQHCCSLEDKKLTIKDFDLLKVLGKGSFGKVYLATIKGEKKYYAIKSLKKRKFHTSNEASLVLNENRILQDAHHPFVVRLHYSFQDEVTLFFVLDFLPGGELLTHMLKRGVFDEETTRFYVAEIVLGLQYLHEKLNIMYRDLKPENILLDVDGHVKITDFGLSTSAATSNTFCGTLFYLAPEVLLTQKNQETADQEGTAKYSYDKCVDWWSLGCLIFQMLAGFVPFDSKDHDKVQREIIEAAPFIPSNFSESAQDLIKKLLTKDPKKRLGYNGAEEIKKHKFFEKVNWNDILNKTRKPPIKTNLTKADDVRNFSKEFLSQDAAETPTNELFPGNLEKDFEGFSYVRREFGGDINIHTPNMLMNKV